MVINTGNHIAARAAMPASVGATGMLAVHLMGRASDGPRMGYAGQRHAGLSVWSSLPEDISHGAVKCRLDRLKR
jgi:hypothetical protein